ncbi:hypothetical protein Angca_007075 [Angiostrongylus cantonensis]|nr:hypothetical protein Angca_007075 [Angiostrongylus cantonensis]
MGTGAAPDNYDEFSKEVIARMREPPFYCVDDCQGEEYSYAAAYAGQLYDGVYAYARALNSTLKKNATALRNGTAIMENIEMTFDGMSGVVKINDDGMRRPMYYFDGLDNNSQQYLYGTISVEGSRGLYKPSYSSETELWWTRGGIRPRDEPLCGFTGNECPRNFFEEHLAAVVVVAVVVAVMIIAAIVSICYVV